MIEQTLERIAVALETIASSKPAAPVKEAAPAKAAPKKAAPAKAAAKKAEPPAEAPALDFDGVVALLQQVAEDCGRQHVVRMIGALGATKVPEVAKMPEHFEALAKESRELIATEAAKS